MLVTKAQSNEGRSRINLQSIFISSNRLSLVPPLRYFGGISIFLYESYRARVLDIRKHVSEQTMIERLRKNEHAS